MTYILVEGANQVGKTTLIGSILPFFNDYTFIKLPTKADLKLSVSDTDKFDLYCLREIMDLPRGKLLTDRGYISHVMYKTVRRIYNNKLDIGELSTTLIRELTNIERVVRPYDFAFILYVQPTDYDRWFNLHVKRFEFMDDPERYTVLVYLAWENLVRLWRRNVILIPAYTPLPFQIGIVKMTKEVYNL